MCPTGPKPTLGIDQGDFAAAYFSGNDDEDTILAILEDYARREMRNCGMSWFVGDDWVCKCGNTPLGSGFQPCLRSGQYVEPTKDAWTDGHLLRCVDCGAIVELDTHTDVGRIVGETSPEFVEQSSIL